jgi:hypothetical protein
MVARANIAVADGETSPVTHTFTPNGDVNGVLEFRNLNATTPAASETITLNVAKSNSPTSEFSIPGKKVGPRKIELRLKMPSTYTDAVSGLTLVDFVNEGIVQFLLHPRTTEQQAENIRKMLAATLTETNGNQVLYAVDKGEAVW